MRCWRRGSTRLCFVSEGARVHFAHGFLPPAYDRLFVVVRWPRSRSHWPNWFRVTVGHLFCERLVPDLLNKWKCYFISTDNRHALWRCVSFDCSYDPCCAILGGSGQLLIELHCMDPFPKWTARELAANAWGPLERVGLMQFVIEPVCWFCEGQYEVGFINEHWTPTHGFANVTGGSLGDGTSASPPAAPRVWERPQAVV